MALGVRIVGVVNNLSGKIFHQSVLPEQVIEGLNCSSGKVYVDCTAGGAGHSLLIATAIKPDGILISMDVDSDAIQETNIKLVDINNKYIVKSNYMNLPDVLKNLDINSIDGGILIDLGVSSHQLTSMERGFSFRSSYDIDMRMDQDIEVSAADLLNTLSADELAEIFFKYGEERYSNKIARAVIDYRKSHKIETALQLTNIVESIVPRSKQAKIHPATRIFQALRIAVNNELDILQSSLEKFIDLMSPGARLVVISFHSLEDRIVKQFMKHWSCKCVCPPKIIECRCNHVQKLKIINKKPIIPDENEVKNNPAARSAKLRIAERI